MGCGSAKISHTAGAGSANHQTGGCNAFEEEPTPVYTESKQAGQARRGSKSSKGSKKSKKSRESSGKRPSRELKDDELRPLSQPDLSTRTSISGNSKIRVTLSKDGSLLEVETERLDVCPRWESEVYTESCNHPEFDPQPSTSTATNQHQHYHPHHHHTQALYQGGPWGFGHSRVHHFNDVIDGREGSRDKVSSLYKHRAHSSLPNIKQYCSVSSSLSSDGHRQRPSAHQQQQQQQQPRRQQKPTGCYCCCGGPNTSNGGGLETSPTHPGKSKKRSSLKSSLSQRQGACKAGCQGGLNICTCEQRATLNADLTSQSSSSQNIGSGWPRKKKIRAKSSCIECPVHGSGLHLHSASLSGSQEESRAAANAGDCERCADKSGTEAKARVSNEIVDQVKDDPAGFSCHQQVTNDHHCAGCVENNVDNQDNAHTPPFRLPRQRVSPTIPSPIHQPSSPPHPCNLHHLASPYSQYVEIGTQSPVHVRYHHDYTHNQSQVQYSNGAAAASVVDAHNNYPSRQRPCRDGGCEEFPSGTTSVQSSSTRDTCLSRENSRSSNASFSNHPNHHHNHHCNNNNHHSSLYHRRGSNNNGHHRSTFSRESSLSSDYSSLSAQSTHETIPELCRWNSVSDASHASLRSQTSSERSSAKRRIGHQTKEQIVELGRMVANPVDHIVQYEMEPKFEEEAETDLEEGQFDLLDPASLVDIHVHTDFFNDFTDIFDEDEMD